MKWNKLYLIKNNKLLGLHLDRSQFRQFRTSFSNTFSDMMLKMSIWVGSSSARQPGKVHYCIQNKYDPLAKLVEVMMKYARLYIPSKAKGFNIFLPLSPVTNVKQNVNGFIKISPCLLEANSNIYCQNFKIIVEIINVLVRCFRNMV